MNSPLIDPAACSLVLIAPGGDGCAGPGGTYESHRRNSETLLAAAQIVDVPVFVCCRDAKADAIARPHRAFVCETHGCIWKNEALREALDSEDRSALILAGHWLDCEVMIAALCALADCYDVYVPLDASPERSEAAARLAEARLVQAGATPLLTAQILREWMIEASSGAQRASLMSLMT